MPPKWGRKILSHAVTPLLREEKGAVGSSPQKYAILKKKNTRNCYSNSTSPSSIKGKDEYSKTSGRGGIGG